MGQIKVEKDVGGIKGLCVITPTRHTDERGYFMETYSKKDMNEFGLDIEFVQDNQSCSQKGVLRGLHYQKNYPQTKLIRTIYGTIYSVAVDLRFKSSTYGKWHGVKLTEENQRQFLIPKGFAHGFLVLSNKAIICYKCDDYYHPDDEAGIIWNDAKIGIKWMDLENRNSNGDGFLVDGSPIILSQKDRILERFNGQCMFI